MAPQEVTPQEGGSRTLVDLVEARRRTEAIYSKLMDEMEASVPRNGLSFVKFGKKPEKEGEIDNRALVLREGREIAQGEVEFEYVAITNKGAMKLTLPKKEFDPSKFTKEISYGKGVFEGNSPEFSGYKLYYEPYASVNLLPIGDTDQDFLREAMTKSIAKSRITSEDARSKAALEAAQKEQAKAEAVSNLFNQVIQPPASETPAPVGLPPSPPSPPTV